MWIQKEIIITGKSRGFHLITSEIISQLTELNSVDVGVLTLFLQHTSASLTINENADPSVRHDFESHFNEMIPENQPYYLHNDEGSDDMPAHLKSSILGNSLVIPITKGSLNMGIWQGIYLCEHRNHPHQRTIIATINGQ